MSKFLFVSTYDLRRNTSGNIRTVALMKGLHDVGHVVHVIFVPSDKESDTEIYKALLSVDKIIMYPKKQISFVDKKRISKPVKKSWKVKCLQNIYKFYNRISVYDVFQTKIFNLGKDDLNEVDEDYDYIVSSSEPRSSHKFARKIKTLKHLNSKLIFYWGDPMTNDVASIKLFHSREEKEENKLISVSDLSLYTNPCAVEYMRRKYPHNASKIHWIATSDISDSSTNNSCCASRTKRIGYFGDYSAIYRNIIPFYNSCVENNFDTIICGMGAGVVLTSKANVNVKGRVSRKEVNEFEEECQLLIVIENKTKTGECIQIPGKLYHYALTNKDILVITESKNLSKEYSKFNRFHFIENDKDKIAAKIHQILLSSSEQSKRKPLVDFMRDNIVREFEEIINRYI